MSLQDLYKYRFLSALEISPDGGKAAFVVSVCDKEENGYKSDLYLLADGGFLYYVMTDRTVTQIRRIDEEGHIETLYRTEGLLTDLAVKNGRILFGEMHGMDLTEIYELTESAAPEPAASAMTAKQLTGLNRDALADTYVAQPQYLSCKSEGWEIDGWVLLPKDYDPAKTYPAVLDIHGGPKCAYGPVFTKDQADADIFEPEDQKKIWEMSPLKHAKNVKTPLLFIHSDEDYRCPIAEAYQFYTALVERGVPARLVVFHGENHGLSRGGKPEHRIRRLAEITNWFEKYVRQNTAETPEA